MIIMSHTSPTLRAGVYLKRAVQLDEEGGAAFAQDVQHFLLPLHVFSLLLSDEVHLLANLDCEHTTEQSKSLVSSSVSLVSAKHGQESGWRRLF